MPVFQFTFSPPTAGCMASVVVQTPWDQKQNYEKPSQQFPQGRVLSPPEAAFAFLCNYANQRDANGNCLLYFPPNVQTKCELLGDKNGQPAVGTVQKFEPTSDRQQVNAPDNFPVGNGRSYALPPEQPQKGAARAVPQGLYEDLTDCALPRTSDSLLGDMDGEAGTYTDTDSMGNEVVRQLAMPPSPKVYERR